jgi:hypothetical protein
LLEQADFYALQEDYPQYLFVHRVDAVIVVKSEQAPQRPVYVLEEFLEQSKQQPQSFPEEQ